MGRSDLLIIDDPINDEPDGKARLEAFLNDKSNLDYISKKFEAMGGRTFGPIRLKSLSEIIS